MIHFAEQTRRKVRDACELFRLGQCGHTTLEVALNNRFGLGPDEHALLDEVLAELRDIRHRYPDERDQNFHENEVVRRLARAFAERA